MKAGVCHGGWGLGLMVSRACSWSRSIVWRVSARGNWWPNPICLLRIFALSTTVWAGWSCGSVLRWAASICACCFSYRWVGSIWDSTSKAVVEVVLNTERIWIKAVCYTVWSDLRWVLSFNGLCHMAEV